MFLHSWNKKVIIAVVLIIIQAIIYAVFASKDNTHFSLITFFICSLPGIIGALIIWIEKNKGRY